MTDTDTDVGGRRWANQIALLVFASGFCALAYQSAWLRLLRQVFGVSTAAAAAVLAIFMGGLGVGGIVYGRRADRARSPLALYANLELGVALGAAASPFLISLVRSIYLATGGAATLGGTLAVVVRLLLAAVVLALPTFQMGGTLPAVARAVERSTDAGRRGVGWMYAANTMGAVFGALVATFVAFERVGIQATIWIAAALNLVVALIARRMAVAHAADTVDDAVPAANPEAAEVTVDRPRAPTFVLIAAAAVGFAFFLMELVWYRMLGPILGGSSYTFGMILAVALAGIGSGGLLYASGSEARRPSLGLFAALCALEAVLIGLPFALGDGLALVALQLRPLAAFGFAGNVLAWTLVMLIVVLPAAAVAGYQFPLLVALLGRGQEGVGREVGLAYAWNTGGAILGSLAGGFGLMPLLGATGVWRLVVVLLAALAAAAAVKQLAARATAARSPSEQNSPPGLRWVAPAFVLAAVSIGLAATTGPTAAWRHSGIGAGRVLQARSAGPNDLEQLLNDYRRQLVWEADGVESSVGLVATDSLTLTVNGKSDGNCRHDAPTQVVSPLLGYLLHPQPKTALVVGLGTGSSAGWLAAVPAIEHVDVVELEPATLRIVELCATVNADVLRNPKVNVILGDGRELLLATDQRYDLIMSEPSNPYRAGVASLYTQEFYRAVRDRLTDDGLFLQWLQSYEVDGRTVRTAYDTLGSVFPSVETWEVFTKGDMILVASKRPIVHDLARIGARVGEPVIHRALSVAWGVEGIEGLYTGFVAGQGLMDAVRARPLGRINTDDHPVLEFDFARKVGNQTVLRVAELRALAAGVGAAAPAVIHGTVDWAGVEEDRTARVIYEQGNSGGPSEVGGEATSRHRARIAYANGDLASAYAAWSGQSGPPRGHFDRIMVAEMYAMAGDPRVEAALVDLTSDSAVEADVIRSMWQLVAGRPAEATASLLAALDGWTRDPWPYPTLMRRAFGVGDELARAAPEYALPLFDALAKPASTLVLQDFRRWRRWRLTSLPALADRCVDALIEYEPNPVFEETFLRDRVACYERLNRPQAVMAKRDLLRFEASTAAGFWRPGETPETPAQGLSK